MVAITISGLGSHSLHGQLQTFHIRLNIYINLIIQNPLSLFIEIPLKTCKRTQPPLRDSDSSFFHQHEVLEKLRLNLGDTQTRNLSKVIPIPTMKYDSSAYKTALLFTQTIHQSASKNHTLLHRLPSEGKGQEL